MEASEQLASKATAAGFKRAGAYIEFPVEKMNALVSGQRPLHQLALLQASDELSRGSVHGSAFASVVVGKPTFLQNAAKRGSF